LAVTFLVDESDTVAVYEQQGKLKSKSSPYQQGLAAFSTKLDRVQQMEMLHGYTDLKSELTDYLKKFADNRKVVREEDVKEFFEQLAARKRQRTSSSDATRHHY
jgi:E3 ubiquitin-protein ligase UBR7